MYYLYSQESYILYKSIDERTKRDLLEYASSLQTRLFRKVSFDEAIKLSLEEKKGVEEARQEFGKLYGSLSEDKKSRQNSA